MSCDVDAETIDHAPLTRQPIAYGQAHSGIWDANSALPWIVIDIFCIIHAVINDSSQTVGQMQKQAAHSEPH